MIPIQSLDAKVLSDIRYILCDIDDTLTNKGKLGDDAYSALWDLHRAGFFVIPVTGRPAGWCDMIIRQWPVQAVVGENGAFVYYQKQDGHIGVFTHPSVASKESRQRLLDVQNACLAAVPGCRVAKDQPFRIYDLAIDFNEDPPYLGLDAAQRILDICKTMGAQAKLSSIHVNAWFGQYDKLETTRLFFGEVLGEHELTQRVLFFGDSPNDEPMFAYFPHSCGVENILDFQGKIDRMPAYITTPRGGEGFARAAKHLINARQQSGR